MALSWRWRRAGKRHPNAAAKNSGSEGIDGDVELTIPSHYRCPISLDLMKDPVILSTGITYDRDSIEKWIEAGNLTCPVTNQVLPSFDQIPNHSIRRMIQDWCVTNKSCGVERIPTPRIPITVDGVREIRSRIEATTRRGDSRKCHELLEKINGLAKESERNKRCIAGNGIGSALADMFESFSRLSVDSNSSLLKETLSTLTWAFPRDRQGISMLESDDSLNAMAHFIKCEDDLSSRQNTILVLKELVSQDPHCIQSLTKIDGIDEALLHILKVPISPRSTKATLVVIHHIISSSTEAISASASSLVRMGLIPLILDLLVACDKSLCEMALAVLDSICSWKQGRESAYNNALTIPLLLKRTLRVSNTATATCISCLWKLCLGENKNALVEAVQFGAFQKLLVTLQIETSEVTKEKVTDMLKLINLHRDRLDCYDSSLGFRHIKRSDDL